jgi:hypothetical protein
MNYNRDLWPPAPTLEIIVHPMGNPSVSRIVVAKIDPGADMSLLPQELVDVLSLEAADATQAISYDGSEADVLTYFVDLEVAGYPFEAVEVVVAPHDMALIGRDILSSFIVTLNGKQQTFEMIDP